MPRPLILLIAALLVASVVSAPRPVRAETEGRIVLPALPQKTDATDADKEAARKAYGDVEFAWGEGDLESALRHADEAFRAVPNASTAILRATIYAGLGRPCDAFSALLLASDLDPTAEEKTTIGAQLPKNAAACEPRMAWLVVAVDPPEATVELGGLSFTGSRTVGFPVGAYDIRVTAPGYLPKTAAVQAYAPEGVTATYTLEPEPAPAATKPSDAVAPEPLGTDPVVVAKAVPADSGDSQVLPWLLVGGGGALIATGVGMHVWALGAADDTSKYARPVEGLTDDERKDRFDQANDDMELRGTLAYVFYGVGGAAAVAGSVLLILDATSDGDASITAAPAALPGGAGVVVRGGF